MNLIDKIKTYCAKWKEKRFWRTPDYFLVAIILENDQVYGEVKGELALLNGIPKPESGYFYKDVVKVIGPVGKQFFRDEEIFEFKAVGIYRKSNLSTFTFYAILPKSQDYFYLMEEFKGENLRARFKWFPNGNPTTWEKGYCTANSLEEAEKILEQFVSKGEGREVKNINKWDYDIDKLDKNDSEY